MPAHKGGKKNRKHNNNRDWCKAYRARRQREKNKRVKILKHLEKFPNDKQAEQALRGL